MALVGSGKNCMKEFFFKLLSIIKPPPFYTKPLPGSFRSLKLIKKLSHPQSYFGTGLYQDSRGRRFVVKFWSGRYPDACYYLLRREIVLLEHTKKRLAPSCTLFPEFVNSVSKPGKLILITRFFSGRAGGNYTQAVEFLRRLPPGLPVPVKPAWYFILLFPLIWVIAAVRHWRRFPVLVHSFIAFWLNSPSLFLSLKPSFVHGDLHPGNLLTNSKTVLILDLGQAMYTCPEMEIASTIACPTLNDKFKISLVPTDRRQVFISIGIFCATYNLTRASSTIYVNSLLNLINLCLKPS